MAKSGRVYLFGDGNLKSNPIHGEDLAKICLDGIDNSEQEIIVGGPEILSQKEIACIAFEAIDKIPKITFIPDWVRKTVLLFGKFFIPSKTFVTNKLQLISQIYLQPSLFFSSLQFQLTSLAAGTICHRCTEPHTLTVPFPFLN